MTRRSLKMAILGLAVLLPVSFIIYTVFNALVLLACRILLYVFEKPLNAMFITLGIMALGFIAEVLWAKYKNKNC